MLKILKTLLVLVTLCSPSLVWGQFTAGNIAVLVAAASATNTTCSVVELNKTGTNQTALTTNTISGTGSNAIRVSGSATSTLYASNSNDGTFFCFTGANNTDASSNANKLNPRAVLTFNGSANLVMQTTYIMRS